MRSLLRITLVALLAACTPGGSGTTGAPSGGQPGNNPLVTTIDINLTEHASIATPYGTSGGFAPAVTTVPVGSHIRFVNSDSFAHTATEISGARLFPATSPFGISATTQSGDSLSGGFSAGALQPGQSSQLIVVDKPGTYLFGCFFHYGAPMRGAIIAQ